MSPEESDPQSNPQSNPEANPQAKPQPTTTDLAQQRTELAGKRTGLAGQRTDQAGQRTGLADQRTALAFERTRLASDRTTMGYLRTSISLIGFGFSIPAFFQVLANSPGFETVSSTAPRMLGIALLLLATAMMAAATIQQGLFLRRLERKSGSKHPFSIALASCIFVLMIALMATSYLALQIGKP